MEDPNRIFDDAFLYARASEAPWPNWAKGCLPFVLDHGRIVDVLPFGKLHVGEEGGDAAKILARMLAENELMMAVFDDPTSEYGFDWLDANFSAIG